MTSWQTPSLGEIAQLAHQQALETLRDTLGSTADADDADQASRAEAAHALVAEAMIAINDGLMDVFDKLVARAAALGYSTHTNHWFATHAAYDLGASALVRFSDEIPDFEEGLQRWRNDATSSVTQNLAAVALDRMQDDEDEEHYAPSIERLIEDAATAVQDEEPLPDESPLLSQSEVQELVTEITLGLHQMLRSLLADYYGEDDLPL